MIHVRLLVGAAMFVALGASALGCEEYETPVLAEAPPPVTLNFYGYRQSTSEPPTVVATPAPRVPTSGIAACDAYFARVRSCVRSATSNARALERFERSVDISMHDDAIVARSGDEHARQQLTARCEAALAAYLQAPCEAQ